MGRWTKSGAMLAVILATLFTGCWQRDGAALASGDAGYRDFYYNAPGVFRPTEHKPQSKLWFNDGTWWGILFDRSSEEHHIYRYDEANHSWNDTGTLVDERNSSKSDALSAGNHLYVASAGGDSTLGAHSARILRYTYDPATRKYSPDAGFPVTITSGGMEAIVLARDTTGELWATYTQNDKVYVTHAVGDDKNWATPYVLPVQDTTVSPDDISSVVAFGSQIGVMWSNQTDDAYYFATHKDGDPEDTWQEGTALRGEGMSNDHINLKADSNGRVFAAVKTRRDRVDYGLDEPEILLLVRNQSGDWTSHVFGRVRDKHTRPIVLIDEQQKLLYVFAAAPWPGPGGQIYYKRTDLNDINFPEGQGTPFIQTSTDQGINDPTSTKQNIGGDMGLLVEASDETTGYYVHNFIEPRTRNALTFDGMDDWVSIPANGWLNLTGSSERSYESWIKTGPDVNTRQFLYEEGGESNGFSMEISGGRLYFNAWSFTNGWKTVHAEAPVSPDTIYRAACVYDQPAGEVRLYLNGTLEGTSSGAGPMPQHANGVALGGINGSARDHTGAIISSSSNFGGSVGELRIWNYARSRDEIANEMEANQSGTEGGLIALYKLDDGSGTVLKDSGPHKLDGTISGAPWGTITYTPPDKSGI